MPPASSNKKALLDVLGEVKMRVQDKLGIVDFPMPQFIIIGSQSVGKSRLIESLAGECFNFISGTLGSRRPTVLEFRNVEAATDSKWFNMDPQTNQWKQHPIADIMQIVGKAHNDCGMDVSHEPIYVRVESAQCVDMQIVDLPGYRNFSSNDSAAVLAKKIQQLNDSFLYDNRNVVLCVEECGDAANLSSLRRVAAADPTFKRSILIRNKLDKYYSDLDSNNVNKWLEGFGDLPKDLKKFALTLPHWGDGQAQPGSLKKLRGEASQNDSNKLAALGASKAQLETVGFDNFSNYMEKKIESMFVQAINPVVGKLTDLRNSMSTRVADLKEEVDNSDPTALLATVRACGISFANCLQFVMEGVIRSDINRVTLEDELREFHSYHQKLGDSDNFLALPSEDFGGLDDYLVYLRDDSRAPGFDVAINGGAQYTRLMYEIETFLRFSEIGADIKKRDVLQSFGISMGSVTWSDVIVKLLNNEAHIPMKKRIAYVGERLRYFFLQQKEPIVQFMSSLKGSPQQKLYSVLYTHHAKLIAENQSIRKLVYEAYDAVVDRQLNHFLELFSSTLKATFSNPWVFMKKGTAKIQGEDGEEVLLPSLEDTKARIPLEIDSRVGDEKKMSKWIGEVPTEPHRIDEAVDQVQLLLLKIFAHIRTQVCDQVELFSESFFKLPLLRRLEEDMNALSLSKVDMDGYAVRTKRLQKELKATESGLEEVNHCHKILFDFQRQQMA